MEASRGRGTVGKRRLGLQVCTTDDGRLTWPHSLLRNVLKFLPWELAHVAVWHVTLVDEPASFWTYLPRLVAELPNLSPGPGPAAVYYVFGATSNKLMHMNVI